MTTTALTLEKSRAQGLARLMDYLELTKPKISVLVLATVAVAGVLASGGQPDMAALAHTLLGTALVAASASAMNQWFERHSDALMRRTVDRPLPSGRLAAAEVLSFGVVTILLGTGYLAVTVGWITALLAAMTWLLYTAIYTPLKSRTSLNTAIGAVGGAMPVAIGWSAAGGQWGVKAGAVFLVVFLWQFPHFMSIAWLYRRQYAKAGLKMATVVDPTGRRAGVQAVVTALALLAVSMVPGLAASATGLYFGATLVLGVAYLACAAWFLVRRDDGAARVLLRASLVYLPGLLVLFLLLSLA